MTKRPVATVTQNYSSSVPEQSAEDNEHRPSPYVQLALFDSTVYGKDSASDSGSGGERRRKRGETFAE